MLCQGKFGESDCGWDLTALPKRPPGSRPTPAPAALENQSAMQQCPNGHPLGVGDLLCAVCGADINEPSASPLVTEAEEITTIDGWRLGRRLTSDSKVRERFLTVHEESGDQGVL